MLKIPYQKELYIAIIFSIYYKILILIIKAFIIISTSQLISIKIYLI